MNSFVTSLPIYVQKVLVQRVGSIVVGMSALVVWLFLPLAAHADTETFTTSGSWEVPANVYSVTIECWGGGGGGGDSNNGPGGSGGGGGGYARSTLSVSPGESYSYVVGGAGAGGGAGNGGNTTFNTSTCVANGGSAGADNGGTAGTGGSATGNVASHPGGDGGVGTSAYGGGGGSSGGTSADGADGVADGATTASVTGGGDGGASVGANVNGDPGTAPGGGGSGGGYDQSGGPESGAAGAAGQIRLTYSTDTTYSGTVYTDAGQTALAAISTIKIAIGTTSPANVYSTTTDASGNYTFSFPAASLATTTPVVVWLDNSPTSTAVVSANLDRTPVSGLDLYGSRVIVRAEGDHATTSISTMSFYDRGDDVDVVYLVTGGALVIPAGFELYVWGGTTFSQNGTTTINANASANTYDGSIFVADGAAFLQGAQLELGGSLRTGSTSGAYFWGDSAVIFTATTTGKVLAASSTYYMPFRSVTFNGGGGGWTALDDLRAYDLTVTNGALTVVDDTHVKDDFTNSAVFTSGGTFTVEEIEGWDFSTRSFVASTTMPSLLDGQTIQVPLDVFFKPDGTVMYILSQSSSRRIVQFDLGTPWDVTSITSSSTAFNLSGVVTDEFPSGVSFPVGLYIKDDGTEFYVGDDQINAVAHFTMSTPWDFSTAATESGDLLSTNGIDNQPIGITFRPDGHVMYTIGNTTGVVSEWYLSTPWDVTTGSFIGQPLYVELYENVYDIAFADNGQKVYFVNDTDDTMYEYTMEVPWDLSTATRTDSLVLTTRETQPSSIFIRPDGLGFYATGIDFDRVLQYSLDPATDDEHTLTHAGAASYGSVMIDSVATTTFVNNATTTDITISNGSIVVAPSQFTVTGDYSNAGTFTAGSGEVVFNGGSSQTISGTLDTSSSFNSLTFSGAGAKSVSDALAVTGDYTNDGAAITFVGTTTFSGTTAQTLSGTMTGSAAFGDVVFSGAGSKTFAASASTSDFTVASTSGVVTLPVGVLSVGGNYTNGSTTDASGGTVVMDAEVTQVLAGSMVGSSTFSNLTFQGSSTKLFADAASTSDFTVASSSTNVLIPQQLTISGDFTNTVGGTLLQPDGGILHFATSGALTIAGALGGEVDTLRTTVSGGGTITLTGTASTSDLTIDSGTTFENTGTLGVARSFTNSGTFSGASGAVVAGPGIGIDLDSATPLGSPFSVLTQTTLAVDVDFSADGKMMYILDFNGGVFSYPLSTAWDVSTANAAAVTSYSVAAQEANPNAFYFRPDGTQLFVVGEAGDTVRRFSLSTPWEVSSSSMSYDGAAVSKSVNGEEAQPTGLAFSPDGTQMFVVGWLGDDINFYTLSTPWDPSSATPDASSPRKLTAQQTDPGDLVFRDNGSKLYIISQGPSDVVYEYTLTTPWDITSMATGTSLSVSLQETLTEGLAFRPDGRRMYIAGYDGDEVNTYSLAETGVVTLSGTLAGASQLGDLTMVTSGTTTIANNASTTDFVVLASAGTTTLPAELSVAGNYTNNGFVDFSGNSTTTFNGVSQQTLSGTMVGDQAFVNVVIANVGGNGTTSRSVTFAASASTTGTMVLLASTSVEFLAGATSTFATVDWRGTASSPVWVYSTATGTQHYLVVSGTAQVEYAVIRDSNVCGSTGGGLTATSSTNVSNNTCWTFASGASEGGAGGGTAKTWNATDWTLYDVITIEADNIDDDLTDFPVYVDLADLSSNFWSVTPAAAGSVGADIRVTTNETTPTELPRELVYASSTLQAGELHFKADTISSTTDTVFRIYYNGTTTSDYTATSTYGAENVWTNNFEAVFHLQEEGNNDGDGYIDSTSNRNHGTGTSMTAASDVAGQLGKGQNFDGTNDLIDIGDTNFPSGTAARTMSMWAKSDITTAGIRVAAGYGTPAYSQAMFIGRDGTTMVGGGYFGNDIYAASFWDTTNPKHVVLRYDGTNAQMFGNGTSVSGPTVKAWPLVKSAAAIGEQVNGTQRWDGWIDEVRISTGARSDAWIAAEYLNQATTTDFYSTRPGQAEVTGTLYQIDRSTPITSAKNLIAVVGTSTYSLQATSSVADGTYRFTISTIDLQPTTTLIIYIDDETEDAVTILKLANNSLGLNNIDLYRDHMIVRHEDGTLETPETTTSISTSDFAFYDAEQDADLNYFASSTDTVEALTVLPFTKLYLWPGTTFIPGGGVTIRGNGSSTSVVDGSLELATSSTYQGGSDDLSLAGSLVATTTSTFVAHASGTRFTATTTGKTVGRVFSNTSTLGDVRFIGSGGGWTWSGDATTTGVYIGAGTVDFGSGSFKVEGDFTNNSTMDARSARFTFGSSSSLVTQTLSGSLTQNAAFGEVTMTGGSSKVVAANASTTSFVADASSGTTTISAGGVLSVEADFTHSGVAFLAEGSTVVVGSTSPSITNTLSGTLGAGSTLGNLLLVGSSSKAITASASTSNFTIATSSGTTTIDSGVTISVAGDFTQRGTLRATQATFVFATTSADTTQHIYGTVYGDDRLGNVVIQNPATTTFAVTNASTSNITFSAGTTTLPSGTLSVAGDFTNNAVFAHNSGTVVFNATNTQQIATGTLNGTGAYNRFNNLTLTNTSQNGTTSRSLIVGNDMNVAGTFTLIASTSVQFAAGATTTAAYIDFTGAAGSPVWLRSSATGTQWNFDVTSQTNVLYVNVADSNACGSPSNIEVSNGTDVSNNTCWTFITGPSIASAANQVFGIGQATTTISAITITDNGGYITAANDVRIVIATGTTAMKWDTTDTTASIGGTASGKVDTTVSYEGEGSIVVIPVTTDLTSGETLVISGLSFAQFTATSAPTIALSLRTDGVADTEANATDDKTIEIRDSLTLADHTAGQVENVFTKTNITDAVLYRFNLAPQTDELTISELVVDLVGVRYTLDSDITNVALYRDLNNNGTVDAGEPAVGGSGAVSITDQTGTITFSTSFSATTSQGYLLEADVSEIGPREHLTVSLTRTGITTTVTNNGNAVVLLGTATDVLHERRSRGGGSSVGSSAPPGRSVETGGSEDAGDEISEPAESGNLIGNAVGFMAPASTSVPHNDFSNPENAFVSDGTYAVATTDGDLQSYADFNFSIPGSNQIVGIAVKIEASGSGSGGSTVGAYLSYNGGGAVTAERTSAALATSTETLVQLGGPSDKWGYNSWTPSSFSTQNFRLRLIFNESEAGDSLNVDAVQVRVYHQATGGGGGGGDAI